MHAPDCAAGPTQESHNGIVAGPQLCATYNYHRADHERILDPNPTYVQFLINRCRSPAWQECLESCMFGRFALSDALCRSQPLAKVPDRDGMITAAHPAA